MHAITRAQCNFLPRVKGELLRGSMQHLGYVVVVVVVVVPLLAWDRQKPAYALYIIAYVRECIWLFISLLLRLSSCLSKCISDDHSRQDRVCVCVCEGR